MGRNSRRIALRAVLALGLAAAALLFAVGASARDGHGSDDGAQLAAARGHDDGTREGGRLFLRSALAPSVPDDPAIHGVLAGAVPWVLDGGGILLQAGGRLRVEIEGLVIPVAHGAFPAGTARPVATVSASLYCAPDAAAAAATTGAVPITESGDATIDETIALPATCLAPIVLVHPNGDATRYIAVSGAR